MYIYKAYGLGIHSELPLPELVAPAEVPPDVVIRIRELKRLPPGGARTEPYSHITEDEAYFFWEQVGSFLVRAGKEILIEPFPEVGEELIRLPLLGTVLAVLLHQRGLLVLHASAVAIGGGAVAFMGEKGWGKSTIAAALCGRGHGLMADDVVALDAGGLGVLPGYPQLKLWPESAAVMHNSGTKPICESALANGKLACGTAERFTQNLLPLQGVYVLAQGEIPRLKLLQPREALLKLIANSYVARFGKQMLQGAHAALHLRQCLAVARQVPIYSLERPNSLALLPVTAQLVEEQFGLKPEAVSQAFSR